MMQCISCILNIYIYSLICKDIEESPDVCPLLGVFPKSPLTFGTQPQFSRVPAAGSF